MSDRVCALFSLQHKQRDRLQSLTLLCSGNRSWVFNKCLDKIFKGIACPESNSISNCSSLSLEVKTKQILDESRLSDLRRQQPISSKSIFRPDSGIDKYDSSIMTCGDSILNLQEISEFIILTEQDSRTDKNSPYISGSDFSSQN